MNDRDCENCKHHTEKGCDSWDCEFEKRMTREEAIEFIGQSVKNDVDMAKVADAIIAIEQEPCEDAISRQYLLDNCVVDRVTMPYVPINKIENAPPVTPQPKTGHWREDIDNNRKWDRVRFYCSECGGWQTYGRTHYCPNCGAKMEESEEKK